MAITYVGAAGASSDSVSLPSFTPGDVAIVVAVRAADATVPSLPTGWTSMSTFGSTAGSRTGYRYLQSGDTTTGTWTNAQGIAVAVYRGTHPVLPVDYTGSSVGTEISTSTSSVFNPNPGYSNGLICSVQVSAISGRTVTGAPSGWTNRAGTGQIFGVADISTYSAGSWTWSAITTIGTGRFSLREATTFPIVADQDTTSGTVTSNSSSWTLTYPKNIAAGDLLLAMIAVDGQGYGFQAGSESGWVYRSLDSGANTITAAKKIAAGTETGTFTSVMAASEQGAWTVIRIPAGTWYGTIGSIFDNTIQPPSGSVTINLSAGSSANPDPPSLDPSNWDTENTLWLAVSSSDTSRTYSAYPSSPDTFTNTGYLASGGSGGATLAWARLEKNASSVDPGTFTISNSDDWAAATIAIRPYIPVGDPPTDDPRQVRVYRQLLAH